MHTETDQHKLKKAFDFIASHKLAVLSTVTQDSKPESAAIGFAQLEDNSIVFGTFSSARKYENLKHNSLVSMVIGWDYGKTVQLEGVAEEISEPKEIDKAITSFLAKIPSAAKFLDRADERLFRVSPKWIRYSDLSVDPWEIFEIIL